MRRYRSNRWLPICRRLALGLSLVIAAPAAAVQFSIVVIPDTQYLSQCHPAVFQAQTQWIVDNRVARNIVYVAQLGDLTQDYGDAASEWANAVSALSLLENPVTTGLTEGIPYGVLPGNHDVDGTPGINATGNSPNYNVNFGPTRFSGRAYYQGSQNAATNDNNYTFFSAGGIDFMAINLAYANNYVSNNNCADPGSNEEAVLCWADGLLTANSTRKAIITSHHILDNDGTFGPYGQAMWNRFQDNANLYLMLSAHMHTCGQAEAWRKKSRTGGMGDVHILMSNYQDYDYSGTSSPPACSGTSGDNRDSGYMRVLTFDSVHDDIAVETISPCRGCAS